MKLRRLRLALGALLFVAGAAVLGVGLFSYFDSASSESPYLTGVYTDEPVYDRPVHEVPTAVPTETPPVPPPGPPAVRDVPYRMIIDKFSVNAPVLIFGLDEAGVPQVPLNGGDVAWYEFSANPGTGSNAVFAGHVNWNRAPGVFARLKDLEPGDTVRLVAQNGTELVYSVSDNFQVDPADPTSLQVMAPTPTDTITLITCGGTWIPDPSERLGGDYTNRVIVRATLVSINAAAVPQSSSGGG